MPDLLILKAPDWTLQVWSRDVETPRHQLQQALAVRDGKPLPPARIRLAPAEDTTANGQVFSAGEVLLANPLFFENRQYDFEFEFAEGITDQQVHHRLRAVEDCFHRRGRLLRGNINAGNDIGWFRLGLSYRRAGKPVEQSLSFEVLPTKMDMESDLQQIMQTVDAQYPLWRFSLAQKTELELAWSRKPHEQFPLLWLAHFTSLREKLETAVKQVINTPHSRLLPVTRSLQADRLKGRIGHRLEERVTENLQAGEYHRRYSVTVRKLSIDTPENRFVKMVLMRCVHMLARIERLAMDNNKAPDQQPLSKSFFDELKRWAQPLGQYLARPFFREVGDFNGMSRESLVLHHKAGYSGVYRIWQQLKLYLDTLGAASSISMKTVAELYEVWCLLEIRNMLLALGFKPYKENMADLYDKGIVKDLKNGMGASFVLYRDDISIRLAHEPVFSRKGNNNIHSWITAQKPDILLEATFGDNSVIHWIFDAKYRIANRDNTQGNESLDYAHDDAINQMHRYRDALIHVHKDAQDFTRKSRPVLGAYVLYPGWFDETAGKNPYGEAINEVGIGAFPMLPGRTNKWLRDFLAEKLGNANTDGKYGNVDPEKYFVEESARIPYRGMTAFHYKDLAVLFTGPVQDRSDNYRQWQREGVLAWYHTQQIATERQGIESHIIQEIRFLGVPEDYAATQQVIQCMYPVRSVKLVRRAEISQEQSGKTDIEDGEKLYWLFELGKSIRLSSPVVKPVCEHFEVLITDLDGIVKSIEWSSLPKRYSGLM